MTPPAPMPERDFHNLLKERGCRFEETGKNHFSIYRDRDNKLITRFAVRHSEGVKREVKPKYIELFLEELAEIEQDEKESEETRLSNAKYAKEDYKHSEWYQKQQEIEEQLKQTETTPPDRTTGD